MKVERTFVVYILSSKSRVLYVGITNKLEKRIYQHKRDLITGFTSRYQVHRLVYFEVFRSVNDAIAREKQIKSWRREKKVDLIESKNPTWDDMAADWESRWARIRQALEQAEQVYGMRRIRP